VETGVLKREWHGAQVRVGPDALRVVSESDGAELAWAPDSGLTLNGGPFEPTADGIALADAVNRLAGDLIATPVGSTLVLISSYGASLTAGFEIVLAGVGGGPERLDRSARVAAVGIALLSLRSTPQYGETWTVRLSGSTAVSVSHGSVVNGVTVATRAQFASALAFQINTLAGYRAVPTGQPDAFAVVSTGGAPLGTLTAEVTRPGTVATVNTSTARRSGLTPSHSPKQNTTSPMKTWMRKLRWLAKA
jgi:hypothetical protein